MRNPYSVGRWVSGRNHYGRELLIESLLESREAATWLVGTRRLGKTSLLMELARRAATQPAAHAQQPYYPLFLDLQGCGSPEDLAYELDMALDDHRQLLAEMGVDVEGLPLDNASAALRTLARALEARNHRLLLLVDEAEALLAVARGDARWLSRLRKTLLEGRMRTVLASTRLLSQLNHLNLAWKTSPFLFGFQLVNLWVLEPEAAVALIRQTQGTPVDADDGLVAQILAYCHGHPFLIQYLCRRLFATRANGDGYLRAIETQDLEVDHMLAGCFAIDFAGLTRLERRVLLTLSSLTLASEREVLNALYDAPPERVRLFLYALSRLGYARKVKNQWTVGNEFLRRWLREEQEELCKRLDSVVDESEAETYLRSGARSEAAHLRQKIAQVEKELALQERRLETAPADRQEVIQRRIRWLRRRLARLRRDLERAVRASGPPEP